MGSCFINNTAVFFGAFLGPILLVLSLNTIIFIAVIVILVRHKLRRSEELKKKFGVLLLMRNVASIAFLFGLTWIFGALTVLNANQAFQIAFTLVNSFQGFFIFIFFCVLNNEVRLVWVRMLLGKPLALKAITTNTQKQFDQCKSDQSALESDTKCTHTISLCKSNMMFNCESRSPVQSEISITEQSEELTDMAPQFYNTFKMRTCNMEEVAKI